MAETKVLKGINFPGLEGTYYVPEATAVEDENGYIEIKSYVSDTVEVENLDATLTKEGFAADAKAVGDKVPYIIPMIRTWNNEQSDYSYSFAQGYTYDINQIRKAINNNRVVVCKVSEAGTPESVSTYYLNALGDDNFAYFTQANSDGNKEIEIYPFDDEIRIACVTRKFISNSGPLGRVAKDIDSLDDVGFYGPGWYHKWFNRDELPAGAFEGQWTLRTGYYGDGNYFQIIMPTVGVTSRNYGATCELRRQYDSQNGRWLEWEWVNPPMEPGVEYRTTERHNGQPVYVKVINFGSLPVSNLKAVDIGIDPLDIVNVQGYALLTDEWAPFPIMLGGQIATYHWYDTRGLCVYSLQDASAYTAVFTIKYCK